MMVYPQAGVVWNTTEATVLGDPNRSNTRMLEQWIAIGRAASVTELKTALDKHA
ncbi:hypothetical protein LP420_22820 [Massilia sp. B-10]|nr:hypothetical protein LP420_22820 [Massilia sp. B-10]